MRKIVALEDDAYGQLPAGIYLDGIAAAYAREVGLDATAFVRRLRTHVAPPPPETLQHIVAARHPRKPRRRDPGPSVVQSMVPFAAVVIVLLVAGTGVRLYRGMFPAAAEQARVVERVAETEPSTGPEIGSQLRLERGTSGSQGVTDAAGSAATAAPAPPKVVADLATPVDIQRPEGPLPPVSTLTGVWTLETKIESTTLKAFEGLRLGYRLELRQDGDRIEGTGLKVAENGVPLSGPRRTPITVHGTLGDGRVRLTFGEQGARRRTTGTLNLVIDESGVLRGGFASDAARSAGAAQARRL